MGKHTVIGSSYTIGELAAAMALGIMVSMRVQKGNRSFMCDFRVNAIEREDGSGKSFNISTTHGWGKLYARTSTVGGRISEIYIPE